MPQSTSQADSASESASGSPSDDRSARRRGSGPSRRRRSWARRKRLGRLTVLAVLLVLVIGVGVVVLTWDSGFTPPSARASAAAPTAATTSGTARPSGVAPSTEAPVATTFRLTITAVGADRWSAQTRNGLEITVVLTPATEYTSGFDAGSFATGDVAVVAGDLASGVLTATKVRKATSN